MQREAELNAWRQAGHTAAKSEAFAALFRQHYDRVYQVLYRLVGDQADDLAQEVFLRLYQRPPRETGAELAGWLYRVATRLGYNALRGRRRWQNQRDSLGQQTWGQGWQQPPVDPQVQAEQHATQMAVRAALAQLKQRDASLLTLRASGLSYRELAETLGLRASSVGKMLSRAEAAFAKVYAPMDDKANEGGDHETSR